MDFYKNNYFIRKKYSSAQSCYVTIVPNEKLLNNKIKHVITQEINILVGATILDKQRQVKISNISDQNPTSTKIILKARLKLIQSCFFFKGIIIGIRLELQILKLILFF